MPLTNREYDEAELDALRWRLADVTDPSRQVPPTEEGQAYRLQLKRDIHELEERLASEEDDTIPESPTTIEARAAEEARRTTSTDREKMSSASSSQDSS